MHLHPDRPGLDGPDYLHPLEDPTCGLWVGGFIGKTFGRNLFYIALMVSSGMITAAATAIAFHFVGNTLNKTSRVVELQAEVLQKDMQLREIQIAALTPPRSKHSRSRIKGGIKGGVEFVGTVCKLVLLHNGTTHPPSSSICHNQAAPPSQPYRAHYRADSHGQGADSHNQGADRSSVNFIVEEPVTLTDGTYTILRTGAATTPINQEEREPASDGTWSKVPAGREGGEKV